jgi:hypothetical protein
MIEMIYSVKEENKQSEKDWLKTLGVFPSVHVDTIGTRFGVIVNPEVAVLLSLRHTIELKHKYFQR